MSFQGYHFDPFDIISSFAKLHQSGARHPLDLDALKNIMDENTGKRPIKKPGNSSTDLKETLWAMVKENAEVSKKYHSFFKKMLQEYISSAQDITQEEKQKAAFWADQLLKTCSPSNYFWTNPVAVKRFLDSNGQSLVRGFEHWRNDIIDQNLLVKSSDPGGFQLGENLAYTPGNVIFRNELMELIQYQPSTDTTFCVPIVLLQPWINKYYIFDLQRENSFIRYLRDQRFTVFVTSWKNPGADLRHIDFEDYMFHGALKAVEVAKQICGVNQVHVAGYCIGGTLLAALMAWLNRGFAPKGSLPIGHWTLFSTLVDFSNPGELGVFISEKAVETMESIMGITGYLDQRYMDMAFRMLRPDALIWRYVANNYLQGNNLPKSDVLYWNSDNTRLPEKMASTYLNDFYLNNKLCRKDALQLGGRPIDLGRIGQPLYAVGALQDHISPWKETFKIGHLVKGPTRYVATTDGHIAGIVNPPSPYNRKKFRVTDGVEQQDADAWFITQEERQGSWWPDWIDWLSPKCGPLEAPPPLGNLNYVPIERAPGSYVMEK